MLTDEQLAENRRLCQIAERNAKKILKPGDRLRVTKCPGTKRWITFAEWEGHWIVSKSGIDDYSPRCVDRLNGGPVDFTLECINEIDGNCTYTLDSCTCCLHRGTA